MREAHSKSGEMECEDDLRGARRVLLPQRESREPHTERQAMRKIRNLWITGPWLPLPLCAPFYHYPFTRSWALGHHSQSATTLWAHARLLMLQSELWVCLSVLHNWIL